MMWAYLSASHKYPAHFLTQMTGILSECIHLIPGVNKGGAILVLFCVLSSGWATLSVIVQWHNTLAILVKMTSIICSVRGCHNHWNKRGVPLQQYCVVHGKTRAECCWASFNLHPPPSSDEDRRMWLEAPEPSEKTLLCSFHFVDGRPSDQYPYPEKWLGYVIPPAKKACWMLVTLQGKITF